MHTFYIYCQHFLALPSPPNSMNSLFVSAPVHAYGTWKWLHTTPPSLLTWNLTHTPVQFNAYLALATHSSTTAASSFCTAVVCTGGTTISGAMSFTKLPTSATGHNIRSDNWLSRLSLFSSICLSIFLLLRRLFSSLFLFSTILALCTRVYH